MAMPGAYQPAGIIATVFDNDVESLLTAQPLGHMSHDYANQGSVEKVGVRLGSEGGGLAAA